MVAGKVRAAMGFPKSPSTPKVEAPMRASSVLKPPAGKSKPVAVAPRTFGAYFPRSSAQVQPRPPDVADLVRLVEELRERESRLSTELLAHKLHKETAAIVPSLEREIAAKSEDLSRSKERIQSLEAENRALKLEVESLRPEIDRRSASLRFQGLIEASARSNLVKNLRIRSKSLDIAQIQEAQKIDRKTEEGGVSGVESNQGMEIFKPRVPRVPKPPPTPTFSSNSSISSSSSTSTAAVGVPPPPPPPPPPAAKSTGSAAARVRRVPEVVELYHSLMRRDSRRELGGGVPEIAAAAAANSRGMIGEIENRSAHLLAIKTDVEMQGDFIQFLIKEVETAVFTDIEDVVAFVKWLDDELSFLVDERAVLKHFNWPERKADAMREAAFGYRDLKKLESEASSFRDDARQPCASALKKLQALLEKLEHGVYNAARARESAIKRYRAFQIPWEWMLEGTGLVSQIKLASVKLAMKYMRRISSELKGAGGGPEEEELMLQGVRFAFRVHQFAGGFDVETMRAFQELRSKACSLHFQCQN